MDAAIINRAILLLLFAITLWGIQSGWDLIKWLRKSRGMAEEIDGLIDGSVALCLNGASWALLLAIAFIYPTEQEPLTWRGVFAMALLFVGSSTITYAQNRFKAIYATPRIARAQEPRIGEDA